MTEQPNVCQSGDVGTPLAEMATALSEYEKMILVVIMLQGVTLMSKDTSKVIATERDALELLGSAAVFEELVELGCAEVEHLVLKRGRADKIINAHDVNRLTFRANVKDNRSRQWHSLALLRRGTLICGGGGAPSGTKYSIPNSAPTT